MPRNRDTSAAVATRVRNKHQRWAAEMREAGYPLERELLRTIRNEIGELEANSAYEMRARALAILFNHEHAAIGKAS